MGRIDPFMRRRYVNFDISKYPISCKNLLDINLYQSDKI
jgi:hypothetical protein